MFVGVIKRKITANYFLMNLWFVSLGLRKKLQSMFSSNHIKKMYRHNSKI